ncbi:glycosyltransferase [Sporomusa sp. KB1]|uniref:glycosyltransferase n=1 Tax=Sporomusa sp. KB1 TaxID=943346 RepID=UPI00119DE33E|nr:glycosyltransferase [Sporomusa sp. KB1]TWH47392.1 glycosyltransferase involved in cell wall biosynthesis [Sporomusa sp. KB1]
MAKISACVITKNEEECIGRCLQSVKDSANEIIVVDTGSTDATVPIAQQFGARIYPYQWRDDFSAARNYALDQAKGDWIIFLDADEYIAAETIKNVRKIIDKVHGNRKIEAIRCQLNNLEGVGGTLRSSNPCIRVFRHSPVIRYKGRVHETVFKHEQPVKPGNVSSQMLLIYHTGYTKEKMLEKVRRNTAIVEEEVKNGIIRDMTYCYLSDGCWREGKYEKAIEYAQKAIKQLENLYSEIDYKPYVFLINSMTCIKTYSEEVVTQSCQEAIEKFPHHPEIWMFTGLYYRSIGRCEKALAVLLKAVETNACYNDFNRNNDFYALSAEVYLNIAQIYEMKNQSSQALEYYVNVLQRDKYNQVAFDGLLALIRQQEPAAVIYFLNTIYTVISEQDIRFLVEHLTRLKVKKVLDYYHKNLMDKFGDKKLNGLVLFTSCKFDEVFPFFADVFRKHGEYDMELLAVVALLVNESPDAADLLGTQLQPAFRRIINAYFKTETEVQLTDEDFPVFCDVVAEVIYLGSREQVEKLLDLGKQAFSDETARQIGPFLIQQRFFGYGADMTLYYIKRAKPETEQLSLLYCDVGYCYYRLKNFAGAAAYFSKALESGYQRKYIVDFLEWSQQQCSDTSLKDQFNNLKTRYAKQLQA